MDKVAINVYATYAIVTNIKYILQCDCEYQKLRKVTVTQAWCNSIQREEYISIYRSHS